jgi:hypothetical protein
MPTTAVAAAVAAVVLVAYIVLELTNDSAADAVNTLLFPALGLIYVPLCALAMRKARGRLRVAWSLMTLGLASWALGEFIFAFYKLGLGDVPFPSSADAAYLFYVPCVAVALLLFPSVRSWRDSGRMLLDSVLVTGSFFLISWLTVLRAVWRSGESDGLKFVVSLGYPLGDVLVVTLGFLVLLKAPPGLRLTFTLLVAGLAFAALADSLWVYQTNSGAGTDWPVTDILYMANGLAIIVALVAAHHAEFDAAPAVAPPRLLPLWLPILPLVGAAICLAWAPRDEVLEAPVAITGAVLVAVTVIRQLAESVELVRAERENLHLDQRLTDELDSASQYVAAMLPGPLRGPVQVTSRYLPAQAVGGDSFGYCWIDDDHLIAYLVDVSGRGVKPALLAVSVNNLLRAGGLAKETLLEPDRVLHELNSGLSMDDNDGHYFTMWYGVYRLSTGLLRYANAGHPPPLVLTGDAVRAVPLSGASMPGGMLADAEFTAESYEVPPGARVLLYSDGILGDPPELDRFVLLCNELAAGASFWLDDVIDEVPPSGDDSSLVLLTFPAPAAAVSASSTGAGSAASAVRPR